MLNRTALLFALICSAGAARACDVHGTTVTAAPAVCTCPGNQGVPDPVSFQGGYQAQSYAADPIVVQSAPLIVQAQPVIQTYSLAVQTPIVYQSNGFNGGYGGFNGFASGAYAGSQFNRFNGGFNNGFHNSFQTSFHGGFNRGFNHGFHNNVVVQAGGNFGGGRRLFGSRTVTKTKTVTRSR